MTAASLTVDPYRLFALRRGQFGLDHVTIRALEAPAAFYIIGILLLHFRLAHQEEVDVIGRQPRIERRYETLAGHHRRDEPRRHDDDQIRLLLLVGRAAEQRAEDRHRTNPRHLRKVAGILAGQKPRDREALPIAQFDGCRRITRRQRLERRACRRSSRAFVKSSSLTSGSIFKLMMPRDSTIGRNLS